MITIIMKTILILLTLGTLDIESAIRAFSIRTMVACPITDMNRKLISSVIAERTSQFLNNLGQDRPGFPKNF